MAFSLLKAPTTILLLRNFVDSSRPPPVLVSEDVGVLDILRSLPLQLGPRLQLVIRFLIGLH